MTDGQAQQAEAPDWALLAECSAVFSATANSDGYSGSTDNEVEMTREAAQGFRQRAVDVAGKMGQTNAEADVASIMAYLVPRWENRVDSLVSLRSNIDWIAYCGRLGRQYGVIGS